MYAAFHLGYKMRSLLFDNVDTNTVGEFIGACICILVLSILFESLKFGLARVHHIGVTNKYYMTQRNCHGSERSALLDESSPSFWDKFSWMFFEMSLYGVQIAIGYCVMLLVMMCNVYIFLIVVLSSGLCYAVFGLEQGFLKFKSAVPLCESCSGCSGNQVSDPQPSSSGLLETECHRTPEAEGTIDII